MDRTRGCVRRSSNVINRRLSSRLDESQTVFTGHEIGRDDARHALEMMIDDEESRIRAVYAIGSAMLILLGSV